jgi:hypothetical protein
MRERGEIRGQKKRNGKDKRRQIRRKWEREQGKAAEKKER